MNASVARWRPIPLLCAVAAVAIWSSLAALSVSLRDIPALQLTGIALVIGGSLSLPWWRQWQFDPRKLALGCYGLFLYHLLFITALRHAPAVQANLVHYLWPTLIVVLSPLFVPGVRLRKPHLVAAGIGLAGAATAILGGGGSSGGWHGGYSLALAAALVWSTYSLLLRRSQGINAPTTGLCCLLSGALALLVNAGMGGSAVAPSATEWAAIVALGVGPMGGAFYLWSEALRHGDPRVIGVLANATPVLSTVVLTASAGLAFAPFMAVALVLTMAASLVAARLR
ncbi:MAG: DMT family transporter [Rubrivivax sp.]